MTTEIKKVSITDEGVKVEFTDLKIPKKDERLEASVVANCKWRPHKDFKEIIDGLRVHYALYMEQIEKFTRVEKYLKPFKITGWSMGGDGDSEGVTLVGQRTLKNGMIVNMTTPFIKFEDQDAYWYCYELAELITQGNKEAKEYINGKRTPPIQTTMDFGEDVTAGKAPVKVLPASKKRLPAPNKQIGNGQ